jgi:hypothetical protein
MTGQLRIGVINDQRAQVRRSQIPVRIGFEDQFVVGQVQVTSKDGVAQLLQVVFTLDIRELH